MKNRRLYFLSYIFLCLIFGRDLMSAQTPENDSVSEKQADQKAVSEENLIHLGDLIDVDIIGSAEYDWRGVLTPEGFLSLVSYNENPVYALCRDEESVASDVARAYNKILRQPKVVVRILDRSNRPPSVLHGAVKTPQRFRLNRPVFLNELIINSGGFTEKVSGEIQIFRAKNLNCLSKPPINNSSNDNPENRERYVTAADNDSQYINIKISDLITGKKEANPQILSGDVITVLEAASIYVIGGVANPRQIYFRSQITVSRAVASAGGLTKDAIAQTVTIFRRENKNTKIIEVDLNKTKTDASADITLQASDIVEVAQKGSGKRKNPPLIKTPETTEKNTADLPLRIID
ncbi:MAG: SLBB domain-containing protein [Pyrinomonadaceae bacterium]